MNVIIVTGASSGIGREFVKQIDKHFPHVDEIWLSARRKERLDELSISCSHKCVVMPLNLTKEEDLLSFHQKIEKSKPNIRLLVNSAGFGIMGSFCDLSLEEQSDMITLNCNALTKITYFCIPYMQKNSNIIQLASSAAFFPQPNFAIYAATKSYVLSFSKALQEELRKRKIYITNVCPGPVDTEFFDRAEKNGKTLALKKYFYVSAKDVVTKSLTDAKNKKTISVYGLPIQMLYIVTKLIPHSLILFIMRFL